MNCNGKAKQHAQGDCEGGRQHGAWCYICVDTQLDASGTAIIDVVIICIHATEQPSPRVDLPPQKALRKQESGIGGNNRTTYYSNLIYFRG